VTTDATRFEDGLNIAREINLPRFLCTADTPECAHHNRRAADYFSQFCFLRKYRQEYHGYSSRACFVAAEHKPAQRHCQAIVALALQLGANRVAKTKIPGSSTLNLALTGAFLLTLQRISRINYALLPAVIS